MRRFIRHPTTMPIDYRVSSGNQGFERLRNISAGGLCFASQRALETGLNVRVTIAVGEQIFEAEGAVVWCHGVNSHHEIGLSFRDAATQLVVRMVDQLCDIEQYRQHVRHAEGRELRSEEAAGEWITRHAADLSRLDG